MGCEDKLEEARRENRALRHRLDEVVGRVRPRRPVRYERLFHALPDAVVLVDVATGEVLDANAGAETLLEQQRGELIGTHLSDLLPPAQRDRFRARLDGLAASEETLQGVEVDLLRGDGTTVPAELAATVFSMGGRRVVQAIFCDLSEQRHAAVALREAEDRYRRLVENLGARHFFYAHGPDGVFHYVSPTVTDQLGYEPGECTWRRCATATGTSGRWRSPRCRCWTTRARRWRLRASPTT